MKEGECEVTLKADPHGCQVPPGLLGQSGEKIRNLADGEKIKSQKFMYNF